MSLDKAEREAAVRQALDRVTDPELDEPVTDLRFIERLTIDQDGGVAIGFRLPTYWCAANFAFLMADDMRRAVGALPWVNKVQVTLGEHMYADKINHGLAHGLSFQATFGNEASAELDELRRTFLVKAFQRRQEALLRYLIERGHQPAGMGSSICRPCRSMKRVQGCGRATSKSATPVPGPMSHALSSIPRGNPIDELAPFLRALERVSINADFNGALCSRLLAARFNADSEPSLLEFSRMPPRAA